MTRLACILAALLSAAVAATGRGAAAADPGPVSGLPYRAEASSTLAKSARTYGPENIGTLDIAKPWCEGRAGIGAGEWLELDFTGAEGRVEAGELLLKIQPGYQKSNRLFTMHARPARAVLELRDRVADTRITPQASYRVAFPDRAGVQVFRVPLEGRIDPSRLSLRLTFESAHPGSAFQDLCMTELRAYLVDREGRPVGAPDGGDDAAIEREIDYLKDLLPRAGDGDWAALQGVIRLAGGAYIRTAEGGGWLNEIYLDLLVAQAHRFLFLLGRQEEALRDRVLAQLLAPVAETHSPAELLAAVRRAQRGGVTGPFLGQLVKVYRTPPAQAVRRPAPAGDD